MDGKFSADFLQKLKFEVKNEILPKFGAILILA